MEDQMIIDLYWARSEQAIAASEEKYGPYLIGCRNSLVSYESMSMVYPWSISCDYR